MNTQQSVFKRKQFCNLGIEVESDENLEHDESETDTYVDSEEDCALNEAEKTSVIGMVHAPLSASESRFVSETDLVASENRCDNKTVSATWNASEGGFIGALNGSGIRLSPSQNTDIIGYVARQFSLVKEITESACYQNSYQLMDILWSCELNWLSCLKSSKKR